jgi:hypothetical protein
MKIPKALGTRESMIREVTNDLLTSKFTSEVGHKARVDRSKIENDKMGELREVLRDIGQNLSDVGAAPKGMQYVGSLSVHIYKSELLKQAAFATLSATGDCSFDLADAALRELTGSTLESYSRTRKKLRSGF